MPFCESTTRGSPNIHASRSNEAAISPRRSGRFSPLQTMLVGDEKRDRLEREPKLRIDMILGGTVIAVLAIVIAVGALALIYTLGLL